MKKYLPILLLALSCSLLFGFVKTAKADYRWQYVEVNGAGNIPPEILKDACGLNKGISPTNNCTGTQPSAKSGYTVICCYFDPIKESAEAAKVIEAINNTESTNKPRFNMPEFQIKIPGLDRLSDVSCVNGVCKIPWISEYTFAVYRYGLSIAGILGVLILMASGLLWIVSGGDKNKITKAKGMIFGSITGLILLLGANLLLTNINPDLVESKTINIGYIEKIDLEKDADTTLFGGVNEYSEGCKAAKAGDLSVCKSYGDTEPNGLITVTGKRGSIKIKGDVYQKYQAAMECVRKKNDGQDLFVINEAFRSAAEQIRLKEQNYPAATPCCSNHGSGQGMDIHRKDGNSMTWEYNISSGLKECMNAQGLYANLNSPSYNEPWHWSPTGK